MLGAIRIYLLLCIGTVSSLSANDLSGLYSRSELEYWRGRYQVSCRKMLDDHIWEALLSEERRRLGYRKPILEFPLLAAPESRGHPLNFYVPPNRNVVVFPVFSMKFLDDLCTAYAWLKVNDYSLETLSDYAAILAHGQPPANGFPQPLDALGIPDDALQDPEVNELSLGHFVSARFFIMLHEIGHLVYAHNRHTVSPGEASIAQEKQADAFAATVMKRTSLEPLGMLVWMLADAHWSGYSREHATHPLTGERLRALATQIENRSLANSLTKLGKLLDDPDIRDGFVASGRAGDLSALTPRRFGEKARPSRPPSKSKSDVLFHGSYDGVIRTAASGERLETLIDLEREGDNVEGAFSIGLGFGSIEGRAFGKKLYFDWEWGANYGQGVFEHEDGDSFTGTWGQRDSRAGVGTWSMRRSDEHTEQPLQHDREEDLADSRGFGSAGGAAKPPARYPQGTEAADIANALRGRKLIATHREGGPIYGWFYEREVHLCSSGRYVVYVQGRKQTVLGNTQYNNWTEYGTWEVISYLGQNYLRSVSSDGQRTEVAIHRLPGGEIRVDSGVNVQLSGRAECQ